MGELEKIRDDINKYFNVKIQYKSSKKETVYAMKLYCKICVSLNTYYTLANIGAVVGREHSLIIYHIRTFENVSLKHKLYYNDIMKKNGLPNKLIKIKKYNTKNTYDSTILEQITFLLSPLNNKQLTDFKENRVIPFLMFNSKKQAI